MGLQDPLGPMGPNLSGTYFGDHWADFHDSKATWNAIGHMCALAWSFSTNSPTGPPKGPNRLCDLINVGKYWADSHLYDI